MNIEDRYDTLQRLMTVGAATGAIGMAAQSMLTEWGPSGWPVLVAALTSLAGWSLFGLTVFRTRSLGETDAGRRFLQDAQQDERLTRIRYQAFTAGFAGVLLFQVMIIMANAILGENMMSAGAVASSTIAVGVTISLIYYHRQQDHA